MYKKPLTLLVIFFILNNIFGFSYITYAIKDGCAYKENFNNCLSLQSGNTRSATDYTCISGTETQVLLQVILDYKFKEIDDRIDNYLKELKEGKEYSNDKLDEAVEKFSKYGEYWNEYQKLCYGGIIKEYNTCFDKIDSVEVSNFLGGYNDGSNCMVLVRTKLNAYMHTVFGTLKLNKLDVRKEARKKYVLAERNKYSTVLSIMSAILGYINRIWKEWTTKIRNPYNCK